MALAVLIVGRRDGVETRGGHLLVTVGHARERDDPAAAFIGSGRLAQLLEQASGQSRAVSFVLFHSGNHEYPAAEAAIVGDDHFRNRLIAFTGGGVPSGTSRAFPRLAGLSYPSRDLPWERVPEDFAGDNWALAELLARREESQDTAVTLSILCQGFLGVHAERSADGSESWGPEPIASALARMGWCDAVRAACRPDLEAEKETVTAPSWWREVFSETERDAVVGKLREEIPALDLGEGAAVGDLLSQVFGGGKSIGPPELVARAYCAIADCLGEGAHGAVE